MRRRVIVLIGLFALIATTVRAEGPPRLPRAESYFGLHFDLHASLNIQNAGESLTEAMVADLLDRVKPDFIQIDCKGHPGISSYPTKVPDATHVSGFEKDPLALFRKVTAAKGVALYMHYSGVWDTRATQTHPDWATRNGAGEPTNHASFFGPYVDRVLIPQMRELRNDYHVDGAWIDGECWAVHPDYRPDAIAAFQKATGVTTVPRKRSDPSYFELQEFTRARFRDYVRHYVDDLHRTAPGLQIASNWAFSSRMPEPVDVAVDFFSGDFSPMDAVRTGALEARCLEPQARMAGKPWDLMDWSFSKDWSGKFKDSPNKTAAQLSQSASQVIALGGAYQAYFKQTRDLAIKPADFPVMADLAKFCRARQEVCFKSRPVPQVAILFSTAGWKADTGGIYDGGNATASMQGLLEALLDAGLSVEILMPHHLKGHAADYAMIAVPDWASIEPEMVSELDAYTRAGGRLLINGPRAGAVFAGMIGQAIDREAVAEGATVSKLGNGLVAVIEKDRARGYLVKSDAPTRALFARAAAKLVPDPMVRVAGSDDVHVVIATKEGRTLVNLLNVAGPHRTAQVIDAFPPIGPLTVSVKQAKKPAKVRIEPAGLDAESSWSDGTLTVRVPTVAVHEVIVIE
jgi:hypothetical protein